MEVKDFIIPYKQASPEFKIYCIGDIHAGTIHCVEDRIKAKVAEIAKEKNSYWVGMGDYGEYIAPDDKRFDPDQKSIAGWMSQDDIAESERKWLRELFSPIKKKCVGLLYGNHEETFRRKHYSKVHQHVCDDLAVDNLGFSAFVRFFFRRENSAESHIIKGVFTHGRSGARTKGARLNALRYFMNDFDAHFYAYAHMHDVIIDHKPYMTLTPQPFEQTKLKEFESVGAVTGSWFRTYTRGIIASYGEQKVYPPTVLGCAVFMINAATGEIDVHRAK